MTLAGIVFSQDVVRSPLFAAFAAFVAVNTLLYVTLAVIKMFPKVYFTDFVNRKNRRGATRSIYPSQDPPPSE